jgi:hypothetical protein
MITANQIAISGYQDLAGLLGHANMFQAPNGPFLVKSGSRGMFKNSLRRTSSQKHGNSACTPTISNPWATYIPHVNHVKNVKEKGTGLQDLED